MQSNHRFARGLLITLALGHLTVGIEQLGLIGGTGQLAVKQPLLAVDHPDQTAAVMVVVETGATAANRLDRAVVELITGIRHHDQR